MKIDPKQIARMITEDPDEIAPSDHFDDTEDEYVDEEWSGDSAPCHKCMIPVFEGGLTRESGYAAAQWNARVGQYCESCDTMWCGDCAEAAVAQTRLSFDDYYGNGVHTECPNCAKSNPGRTR